MTIRSTGKLGAVGTRLVGKTSVRPKPMIEIGGWINGGFFVLESRVVERITEDNNSSEQGPLNDLADEGRLGVHRPHGFWRPMDTLRNKQYLEDLWDSDEATWKIWK